MCVWLALPAWLPERVVVVHIPCVLTPLGALWRVIACCKSSLYARGCWPSSPLVGRCCGWRSTGGDLLGGRLRSGLRSGLPRLDEIGT